MTWPPGTCVCWLRSCLIVSKISRECKKWPRSLNGRYSFSTSRLSSCFGSLGSSTGCESVRDFKNAIRSSFSCRRFTCHTPNPNVISGIVSRNNAPNTDVLPRPDFSSSLPTAWFVRTDFRSIGGGRVYFFPLESDDDIAVFDCFCHPIDVVDSCRCISEEYWFPRRLKFTLFIRPIEWHANRNIFQLFWNFLLSLSEWDAITFLFNLLYTRVLGFVLSRANFTKCAASVYRLISEIFHLSLNLILINH